MSLCTAYVNLKTWLAAILDITLSDTVTQRSHHLTPPKKAGKAVEKQKKEKLVKYQELSNKNIVSINHQKKKDNGFLWHSSLQHPRLSKRKQGEKISSMLGTLPIIPTSPTSCLSNLLSAISVKLRLVHENDESLDWYLRCLWSNVNY